MDIAPTLVRALAQHGIAYDIISHHYSDSCINVAHSAHIPEHKMVKPVILEDDYGYVMALIPADQHVKIRELNKHLNRQMGLSTEEEIKHLFRIAILARYHPLVMPMAWKWSWITNWTIVTMYISRPAITPTCYI